jgi:predicted metal-dependent phosphoesterase TrpH/glycosyltransferase involved in cell wall biosynthesis
VARDLHIALVTPFSWSAPSAVNQHVADLARELKRRGHLPVVVVSSSDLRDERRVRALFHRSRGQVVTLLADYRRGSSPDRLLLPLPGTGPLETEAGIPVIPLGSSLPIRLNGGVANLGLPLDVTSRIEKLMLGAEFDLLHVHEPLAPSLSFTALREARSPVVATFHLTPVGVAAYEMGQPVLERFFSRLDARVVTFATAREMMDELYPGDYEVLPCGTGVTPGAAGGVVARASAAGGAAPSAAAGPFALYVYRGDGRRSYRALLRSLLAAFPGEVDRVAVAFHRPSTARWVPRGVPRKLASRLTLVEFETPDDLVALYQAAAVTILPFLGGEWLGVTTAEAMVCGCPVVGPDLPPVRDGLAPPNTGAIFSPTQSGSLRQAVAAALAQTPWPRVSHAAEAERAAVGTDSGAHPQTMAAVAERLEGIYRETLAATSDRVGAGAKTPVAGYSMHVRGIGEEPTRRRMRHAAAGPVRSDWINADLHIHSNYSKDSVSSIESILAAAREIGLGALAIADHNEIDGAFLAQELSGGDPFVIAAEEVKTAEGEVIGLFLKKRIPGGLSFDETLSLIKEQGGLVYVPHPFDALRTTPTYRALVDNLHRIDVIEIYNAKVALSSFNLRAERFAAKYNIVAGAGSDAHVLQALGTALIRMPRFHDPQTLMAALWEADIIAKKKSLLYLQSLKLLQTTLDRVLPED